MHTQQIPTPQVRSCENIVRIFTMLLFYFYFFPFVKLKQTNISCLLQSALLCVINAGAREVEARLKVSQMS